MPGLRAGRRLALLLAISATVGCSGPTQRPPDQLAENAGRRVEYAPGVLIDFSLRRVELDAEVVLRQGPLELLACTPDTKEHESILRVRARPSHIYHALGLIGISPGHPARWDEETSRPIPPDGEEISIALTWDARSGREYIDAWEWLHVAGSDKSATPRPWLFTASVRDPQGRLAADRDGTVITVVEFGTELVGLGEFHSADDAELWLEAFTERIPPVGTRCALVLSAADQDHPTE